VGFGLGFVGVPEALHSILGFSGFLSRGCGLRLVSHQPPWLLEGLVDTSAIIETRSKNFGG